MKIKTIKLLRIGAFIFGWIILITVLLFEPGHFSNYYHMPANPDGRVTMIAKFGIIRTLSSFFSGLGNVFLAFLVAAVLRMIEKEAPIGVKNARRLMIAGCFFFLVDAIVRSCALILSLPDVMRFFHRPDWVSLLPHAYMGPLPFAPILYAASIFVLFTHFSKMVTFESEVA